jgi:hypothetical protein
LGTFPDQRLDENSAAELPKWRQLTPARDSKCHLVLARIWHEIVRTGWGHDGIVSHVEPGRTVE